MLYEEFRKVQMRIESQGNRYPSIYDLIPPPNPWIQVQQARPQCRVLQLFSKSYVGP